MSEEKDVESKTDNISDVKTDKSQDGNRNFDIKTAFPIFIAMLLVGILFVKVVMPALSPGVLAPTTVINQSGNGDYFNDVFGK